MWAWISTFKKKTKNLHFKNKLLSWFCCIWHLYTMRKHTPHFCLAFFLMCPKYFSILLDIFSDYGKVQVLKIKPFLNFSKGILPSLIYIRVDEPTFTGISVKYSERLIHHSHRTAYKSLEMGEGTCVWSHAGWEEKGGCSLRSKVLNVWKQQGLQNTGNEFKRR